MDIGRVLRLLGIHKAELSVLFVNSRRMKLLNAQYRGIQKVTDVLSFPMLDEMFQSDLNILGDIVICIPRALKQAEDYGTTFHDELLRLLIHGLLHLLGYDHEINSYRKRKMEKKERELLDAVKAMA
ncbi:MAG: rRNA maturation RNase YbeY [Nitrospirota bacterium]|nr:rRNA maturation RNase YbeY [Nitrospirota bacterium]